MPTTYRGLDVWQRSLMLVAAVYDLTKRLPPDERYGLVSQLRRAAVSIPCNIAEGYGRATRGEYLNHLSVARGSLNEVETLCTVCRTLGLLKPEDLGGVEDHLDRLRRMLGRLRMSLTTRRTRP